MHNQGSIIPTAAAQAFIAFGSAPERLSRQRQAFGSAPECRRSMLAGVRQCAGVSPQYVGRCSAVCRSAISVGGMSPAVRRSAISGGGMSSAVRRSAVAVCQKNYKKNK